MSMLSQLFPRAYAQGTSSFMGEEASEALTSVAEANLACQAKWYGSAFVSVEAISSVGDYQCMCKLDTTTLKCDLITPDQLTQKNCTEAVGTTGVVAGMTRSTVNNACVCPAGKTDPDELGNFECIRNDYGNLGIECSPEQARNGTCKRNVYKTLGIKTSNTKANPTWLVQDVVLAATSFVGTLMVIALLVVGFKYVMGGFSEEAAGDIKGSMKKLLIWLLLVIWSYTVIRLIQYIARGY